MQKNRAARARLVVAFARSGAHRQPRRRAPGPGITWRL
ncbi:hypothetical protein BN2497_6061 [Janthinobacterium sp. CG23_2]|nr:hypothetical protein BN2497_6061 [Janthinobacterium sp. CG23_2]CUU29428.1 hypothetical protein BN3177_6061 [Janthinobacterium sp. CG23_2]